ncbi:MAG: Transcriptional regulator, PadR family [Anaerolineae bacterium]|nr:MAG: Transcriptional regulator, PadR family [Anaerolineae bacterium]
MRYGRGCGKGFGGGRRKMFFLESCLLVLLHQSPSYGYALMENLRPFGFQPEQMDISILYRALRDLEEMGLVTSRWSDESLGPQRRIYTITPDGEAVLAEWMENLRQHRQELEALEAAYQSVRQKAEQTFPVEEQIASQNDD